MLEEHFKYLGPIEKWCATKADGATAATCVGRCGKSRGLGGNAAGSYWWYYARGPKASEFYCALNGGTIDGVTSMESRGGPEALAFWPGFGLRGSQARPKAPSGQDFGLALALTRQPTLNRHALGEYLVCILLPSLKMKKDTMKAIISTIKSSHYCVPATLFCSRRKQTRIFLRHTQGPVKSAARSARRFVISLHCVSFRRVIRQALWILERQSRCASIQPRFYIKALLARIGPRSVNEVGKAESGFYVHRQGLVENEQKIMELVDWLELLLLAPLVRGGGNVYSSGWIMPKRYCMSRGALLIGRPRVCGEVPCKTPPRWRILSAFSVCAGNLILFRFRDQMYGDDYSLLPFRPVWSARKRN
ncbi:hypothetical protein B0H11DRAFT_2187175 [Mycena galericulata]|nr:hypothetical protein B0H11DRAFT_2187175 [Mycena galericulata]